MPNPRGGQVGQRKTKSEKWDEFACWFVTDGYERLKVEMAKLEGKDFVMTMKDLMEFFKPKLARQENVGKDGGPIELVERTVFRNSTDKNT